MPNMKMEKTPMPEQDPKVRAGNFQEVALGYTLEMAVDEAHRCLQCKHQPCVKGCPVNVQIPDFLGLLCAGDTEGAYQKIVETNSLPAICGRVCPQESQCEAQCVRGIRGESVAIGRLERFVADYHRANTRQTIGRPSSNGHKVAVIGGGPAGLTCAGDLAKLGYDVTVFEAMHAAGGVLMYGIPEFRLPKDIVQWEIDNLKQLGVTILPNMVMGMIQSVEELLEEGYEAVFVGSGAGLPNFMEIPGEGLLGVYSANEYLTRINLMRGNRESYDTPVPRHRRVAVVGGGNVAMDAARSAKRLGAEKVYILYRRSEKEMPARLEEVHHAREEGVEFRFLTNPVEIKGDESGFVREVVCVQMQLGEPDASGRQRPVTLPGSEHSIEADAVIVAIGNSPNPLIRKTTAGLEVNRRGGIVVNEGTMRTSLPRVYAGGDTVTGAATVILAMGAGKLAAKSIHQAILKGENAEATS